MQPFLPASKPDLRDCGWAASHLLDRSVRHRCATVLCKLCCDFLAHLNRRTVRKNARGEQPKLGLARVASNHPFFVCVGLGKLYSLHERTQLVLLHRGLLSAIG